MSDAETVPAEVIPDFPALYVRHVGGDQYRVLSLAGERPTGYETSVTDMTCTCPDHQYRREGNSQLCKHLAATLFQAPQRISVDDHAANELIKLYRNGSQAAVADPEPTEGDTSEGDEATDEDVSEAMEEAAADLDRVDVARGWLETGFAQPEHVDLYVTTHDGVNGVALEPDNQAMTDGVYESFKAVVNAVDGSTVHVGFGDDPCNTCGQQDGAFWYHVPDDRIQEWADE